MIIFLHGPDTFRSRQKLKELREKFVREIDPSGLNCNVLDGTMLDHAELEKSLLTSAFLAPKRMIVIKNLLSTKLTKQFEKKVLGSLQKMGEENIVIFWDSEVDKRKARGSLLYKNLATEKYAYTFQLLSGQQLMLWYEKRFQNHNATIERDALQLLIDLTGNDLWSASTEVDKLCAYTNGRPVTTQDVNELTTSNLEQNIFFMTDAIGQKNKKLALQLLEQQLRAGTKEIELLSTMTWQFKNLLLAKYLSVDNEQRVSSTFVCQKLKIHPFVAKKILGQINNFSLDELKHIYQRLLDVDIKIKTSQVSPKLLFDLLITNQ